MSNARVRSPSEIRTALAAAAEYLRSRQSRNGGFCFYRFEHLDEPNLSDSFHAVAGLRLLGLPVPRADELEHFLQDFAPVGINALYFYAFTLDRLSRAARVSDAALARIRKLHVCAPDGQDRRELSAALKTIVRALRLKRRFAALEDHAELLRFVESLKTEGGYGDKPNLQDTYRCLSIRALIAGPLEASDSRSFVDGLQRPSIAFTPSGDSRVANLDVVYAGLRCCEMLGVPVRYSDDALSFTLACQTGSGGFSAAPDALPDIDLTHRAAQIIRRLAP